MEDQGTVELPNWKRKLLNMNTKSSFVDTVANDIEDHYISEDEIAIKHPTSNAIVRLTDDGCIEAFADTSLGIRLDPTTQSVNIFADNVNFIGKKINFKTKPDGLNWNGYYFNPQVYYENDTEKDQYITGDKNYWVYNEDDGWHWERSQWRYKPMVKTTAQTKYSQGMIDIMKNLGLPVE